MRMVKKEGRTRKREGSGIPPLLEREVSITSADYVIEYQSQTLIGKFGDFKGRLL